MSWTGWEPCTDPDCTEPHHHPKCIDDECAGCAHLADCDDDDCAGCGWTGEPIVTFMSRSEIRVN